MAVYLYKDHGGKICYKERKKKLLQVVTMSNKLVYKQLSNRATAAHVYRKMSISSTRKMIISSTSSNSNTPPQIEG